MTEIQPGLSVNLSEVGVVEKAGPHTIIYVQGRSFIWPISYENALTLIEINNRTNSTITLG